MNLCLKAWRAREKVQAADPQGSAWLDTPSFILQIQRSRENEELKANAKRSEASQLNLVPKAEGMRLVSGPYSVNNPNIPQGITDQPLQMGNAFDSTFSSDFSVSLPDDMNIDWQRWDSIINDFEQPAP
jgi:hypothetical protein